MAFIALTPPHGFSEKEKKFQSTRIPPEAFGSSSEADAKRRRYENEKDARSRIPG
jgi:hypothetical protein